MYIIRLNPGLGLLAYSTTPPLTPPPLVPQSRQRHTKLANLLASMVSEMSPRTRCYNNRSGLVKDVLPYLLQVAVPNLRPVRHRVWRGGGTGDDEII